MGTPAIPLLWDGVMAHLRCRARLVLRCVAILAALTMSLAPNPLPVDAQEILLGGGLASVDHDLLGSPVAAQAAVTLAVLPWLGLRVGYQYARDDFSSFGSTCTGLVPFPGGCADEQRGEEARIRTWSGGVVLSRVVHGVEFRMVPALRRVTAESTQEGLTTGRVRSADKTVHGIEVGLEAHRRLPVAFPIGLYVGLFAATHPWYEHDLVADGYTPFEENLDMIWGEVGFSLTLPGSS